MEKIRVTVFATDPPEPSIKGDKGRPPFLSVERGGVECDEWPDDFEEFVVLWNFATMLRRALAGEYDSLPVHSFLEFLEESYINVPLPRDFSLEEVRAAVRRVLSFLQNMPLVKVLEGDA